MIRPGKKYDATDGCTLVLMDEVSAAELFALTDSCRTYLRQWLPWVDATKSVSDSAAFIAHCREQHEKSEAFHAGIYFKNALAGAISFHRIDWLNRNATIGYWIGEEWQGRGLMTRACRTMIGIGFDEFLLKRVQIEVAVGNKKSRAIPERLGFTLEGISRQSTWLYDHFQDMAVYSLLRED